MIGIRKPEFQDSTAFGGIMGCAVEVLAQLEKNPLSSSYFCSSRPSRDFWEKAS
jgi:hypothetical protein